MKVQFSWVHQTYLAVQTVTLNGGTFSTGATIGYTETVGPLALTGNSFIALGTGVHRLNFANSSSLTWTTNASLTITGWQGTIGISGTAGRVYCGTTSAGLTAAQLAHVQFLIGGIYYTASILNTGELVPGTAITITTGTISGSPFCAGASVVVPFTITGSFISGNVFTAQLSDATGSFALPVDIGTTTVAGNITATIPVTALSGTAYRIRVVSSTPPVAGTDNGLDLTIIAAPVVTISPDGPQSICTTGTAAELTVTDTYDGLPITSHQWGKRSVSGGPIIPIAGETGITYTPTIASLGNGIWYVVVTSTPDCGIGTVSNEVIISIGSSGIWIGLTSDWNATANWCGGVIPDASTDVFIPSDVPFQPIISVSPYASPVTCNTLNISSGASLTLNAGQALTVLGDLINSGTLNLKSDASGIASLRVGSTAPVGGTNNIELFLTGGGAPSDYKWHYISSPVANTSISYFNGNTLDLARYDESLVTTSVDQGWIAADGYIYSDGYFWNRILHSHAWKRILILFWDGSDIYYQRTY